MTATARGRVALAALIAVVAFGAAFAVRRAAAGTSHTPPLPAPLVLPSTPVHASGIALPAGFLPALRRPPRPNPAPSRVTPTPSTTPATPAVPSTPSAPPSGGGTGGGGGPVIVG